LNFKNVLVTPHQAFATNEALNNIAETTFLNINSWQKGMRCNDLTYLEPETEPIPKEFPVIHDAI
jgi:D-lactate dehydrogenase